MSIFDEVETAVETKPSWDTWGQVNLTVFECVWPKGSMPIAFDAQIHRKADRKLRIEIVIIPLDEMSARFNTEFKTVADSHDWAAVTLPSIKALNVPVANLADAWVKITRKPNGKFYAKKDRTTGQPTGEKAELTDFLFLKVFPSQDACLADYLSENAGDPATVESAEAFPVGNEPVVTAQPVSTPVMPIGQLLGFSKMLVEKAAKDNNKDLAKTIASVKQVMEVTNSSFFAGVLSVDSPEIQAMIMAAVA